MIFCGNHVPMLWSPFSCAREKKGEHNMGAGNHHFIQKIVITLNIKFRPLHKSTSR